MDKVYILWACEHKECYHEERPFIIGVYRGKCHAVQVMLNLKEADKFFHKKGWFYYINEEEVL